MTPCMVPRAVPIVEAMGALAVADAVMAQHPRLVGLEVGMRTKSRLWCSF